MSSVGILTILPAIQKGKITLKPGDTVKVIPKAIFLEWRNYVWRAVVEIEGLRKPPLPNLEILILEQV